MRYDISRIDNLLELVRALQRYESETDESGFIEILLRAAENPERQRGRAVNGLYRHIDLVT